MIYVYFFKKFRSFIAVNIKSIGQRASKLLAVSKFENGLTPGAVESGPSGSSGARAGQQTFLETSNFDS